MTNRRQVNAALERVISKVTGRVQGRVYQALVSATPVDTGFARSRWTPTVGFPVTSVAHPPASKEAARASAPAALSRNQQRSQAIEQGYRIGQGKVFITNTVPYMRYLNAGSSAQAPANFVERAIATGIRSVGGRVVA